MIFLLGIVEIEKDIAQSIARRDEKRISENLHRVSRSRLRSDINSEISIRITNVFPHPKQYAYGKILSSPNVHWHSSVECADDNCAAL